MPGLCRSLNNVWIVGDPQECADKIRQLYQKVGGFGTLLTITPAVLILEINRYRSGIRAQGPGS